METALKAWLFDPSVGKMIGSFIGMLVVVLLVRVAKRYLSRHIKDSNNRYRAKKFVTFGGYLFGIGIVATIFSDRLGGLTVALGVAGAGIAFALQEIISSVAGWLAVSFGGFYKTGQRVQLGGIKGDVIDIGILRTTIMEMGEWVHGDLYNGRVVHIANSFVFKEPVYNYSGDFPFLWDEITLPVRYGSDVQLTKNILQGILTEAVGGFSEAVRDAWRVLVDKYMIENASIEPTVTLTANDNWIEFTARYVVDYKKRRSVKDIIFTRILDEVAKTNGKVALASTTFELTGLPQIDVQVKQKES